MRIVSGGIGEPEMDYFGLGLLAGLTGSIVVRS